MSGNGEGGVAEQIVGDVRPLDAVIRSVVRSKLGTESQVDDCESVIQEVWVALLDWSSSTSGTLQCGSIVSVAAAIARNKSVDEIRRRQRFRSMETAMPDDGLAGASSDFDSVAQLVQGRPIPPAHWGREFLLEARVDSALKLGVQQQAILDSLCGGATTYGELASRTGIPDRKVGFVVRRLCERLRKYARARGMLGRCND